MDDAIWQREVAERLGRIEEKVDNIVSRLDDGHTLHLNHGRRIAALERWRSWILGALAVVGLIVAVVFKFG